MGISNFNSFRTQFSISEKLDTIYTFFYSFPNLYWVWKEVDIDRILWGLLLQVNLLESFRNFLHSCHTFLTGLEYERWRWHRKCTVDDQENLDGWRKAS